jgi:lysophospholipase L1-like esterase
MAVCLCAIVSACAGSSTEPSANDLRIACPTPVAADSPVGSTVAVTFQTPIGSGGAAPITVACNPVSGSAFPMGASTVTCIATDARQRTASCNFTVTVARPGDLSATRFMAFGDSITEGALSTPCPSAAAGLTPHDWLLDDVRQLRAYANPVSSYPYKLQNMLTVRYPAQAMVVANEGLGGERITDPLWGTSDATLARLRSRLVANAPQVLLLQEGANDLNSNPLHPEVSVPAIVKGLRDAANEAKLRGVHVFIGTLLPQQAGGCRAHAANHVTAANDQIRAMAAADGFVLVDLYQAFGGIAGANIAADGLHPTEAGYDRMAEAFLAAIKNRLETPRR